MGSVHNPVIPGFHPDPSVCWFDGRYLLVTSSFEYFPAIPLFESHDLISWTQIGHCVTDAAQADLVDAGSSQGYFAPTLRAHAGRLYLVVTNINRPGQFLFTADDPAGPWAGPVVIPQNGIDPSLFFEDDGRVLLQTNIEPDPSGEHELIPTFTRGIQQSVVDLATGALLEGPHLLWEGTGGRFPEAPHLYRRGEYYYLLVAEGGTETGHMATMARSRSPWGPFEPHPRNPVLSHRSLPVPVQSVGHADLIEGLDGRWWAVCLGTRPVRGWHHLGRETFLVPVEWGEDGWPVFGDAGVVPDVVAEIADPLPSPATADTFRAPPLGPHWNTLRGPLGSRVRVDDGLHLRGSDAALTDLDVSFIGRRLQHLDAAVSAHLEVSGTGESGLVVRADEHHWVAIGSSTDGAERRIVWRQRIGTVESTSSVSIPGTSFELRLRFTPDRCASSIVVDGVEHRVGEAAMRYLSSEVAGGFTGAFVGLYAVGADGGVRCGRFDYRPR